MKQFLYILVTTVSLMSISQASAQDQAQAMINTINEMREEEGLPPLRNNPGLAVAARIHSEDMAANEMLEHVSPRTGNPNSRVQTAGVTATRITENIALRPTTQAALQSILQSATHRAQLLSAQITDIGIATAISPRGVYLTQVLAYIEPSTESAVTAPAVSIPVVPTPNVQVPSIPNISVPQIPDVQIPNVQALSVPDVQIPSVPDVQIPNIQVPRIEVPNIPDVSVPQIPDVQGLNIQVPNVQSPGTAVQLPSSQLSQAQTQTRDNTSVMPSVQVPQNGAGVTVTAPNSPGIVTIQPSDRRIHGYWVSSQGRWWYYPLPPNWYPGMALQPDLSVQGPPPGHNNQVTQMPAAPYSVVPSTPAPRRPYWASPRRGASSYTVSPRRRIAW